MSRRPAAITDETAHPSEWRTDGVGAQILMDIGVKQMRLMTAPKVYHGLAGFGLEIVEYLSGDSD